MKRSSDDFWPWDDGCVNLGNTTLGLVRPIKKGNLRHNIPKNLCMWQDRCYTSDIAGVSLEYTYYIYKIIKWCISNESASQVKQVQYRKNLVVQ